MGFLIAILLLAVAIALIAFAVRAMRRGGRANGRLVLGTIVALLLLFASFLPLLFGLVALTEAALGGMPSDAGGGALVAVFLVFLVPIYGLATLVFLGYAIFRYFKPSRPTRSAP